MSFSNEVKKELANVFPAKSCCLKAELSAIIWVDGSLRLLNKKQWALSVTTENAAVARKVIKLLSMLYNINGETTIRKSKFSKATNYYVFVPNQPALSNSLVELAVLDKNLNLKLKPTKSLVKSTCCQASFLRGLFLGGGYVSSPESKKYHLEMVFTNSYLAKITQSLMLKFGLAAKAREKSGYSTVYLKSSQAIAKLLAKLGAHFNLLVWENNCILKEITNQANREVNCESANLKRATKAAFDLLKAIKIIDDKLGLAALPPGLKEFAQLRQAYPQASLKELGQLTKPALSKSAAYHRANRLKQLAAALGS